MDDRVANLLLPLVGGILQCVLPGTRRLHTAAFKVHHGLVDPLGLSVRVYVAVDVTSIGSHRRQRFLVTVIYTRRIRLLSGRKQRNNVSERTGM